MPTNLVLQLSDTQDTDTLDQRKELVEEELRQFDKEMQALGNSPLVPYEMAIVRTYLILKVTGRL